MARNTALDCMATVKTGDTGETGERQEKSGHG